MASGSDVPTSQILRGLHIYMGGVGLQQLFVFCFMYLAFRFQQEMKRDLAPDQQGRVLRLLYVLWAVLILITVRTRGLFFAHELSE